MTPSPNRDAPLSERQQQLLQEARGVILHIAAKLAARYPGHKLEDFVPWCEDGAIAAAQDYREDHPDRASFITYAWSRIWGHGESAALRERRTSSAAVEARMMRGREVCGVYAEHQRDTADLRQDTEEDDQRRPREALEGFATAYIIGYSMGEPPRSSEEETLRSEVRAAAATLKDRDEAIVRMYLFEEMSFAQIAQSSAGQLSETTAKRIFHTAIGRLRKRLARPDGLPST